MTDQNNNQKKPAILGGTPAINKPFPSWPQFNQTEEENILEVLRSGRWERHKGKMVSQFEERFAEVCGVEKSLMVTTGSAALEIALFVAGIGTGDEVLVPPYTFMSTVMSVLLTNALPVFVDIDPNTYCIDPEKMEDKITPRTKAIIPVHLGGMACNMEEIMQIASRHNLVVIEDACQAHLAEWRGKKVGTIGDAGCFSFQVSKNLSAGEGGAIVSSNPDFVDRCFYFHTCGRLRAGTWYYHPHPGTNRRMTEFQAAILLAQLQRVDEQMQKRQTNAAYLSQRFSEIPGIQPIFVPDYVSSHAWHLYIFRYNAEAFSGLHRDKFVEALQKEGVPCVTGYVPLYKEEFIKKTMEAQRFHTMFPPERIKSYYRHLSGPDCPVTEKACTEEGVWFPQSVLLAEKKDMDSIVQAIQKIQEHADQIR